MAFKIAEAFVEIDSKTDGALKDITGLIAKMTLLGPAAGVAGAAVAGAAGGMAAAFGASGIALGGFLAAVKPQFTEVTNAADLYTKAQAAAAAGGEKAAAAQKAYKDALAQMPPATRETALAFIGLKSSFQSWSDSLSSTTMPIFTKGLNALKGALPALTPLVQSAAGALSGFMDKISAGLSGGGLTQFTNELARAATNSLPSLLNAALNVGKGLGGILRAFLPFAGQMAGGVENLTAKFAAWGQSLGQTQGFQRFMQNMQSTGPGLISTLSNLAQTAIHVVQALAPFSGASLAVATALSQLVAAIPIPVLTALAATITTIRVGMMAWTAIQIAQTAATTAWATAQTIAAGASKIWAAAQMFLNAAFWASPITWIVAGIVALIAVIVLIATKTTWFQTAWSAVWNAVKAVTAAVWNGIKAIFSAVFNVIKTIFTVYFNIYKTIITTAWNVIKTVTSAVWNGIKAAITIVFNVIKTIVMTYFNIYKTIITTVWNFIKTISTAVWNAVKTVVTTQINAIRSVITAVLNAIRSAWNAAWNGIKSFVTSAWNGIRSAVSSGINAMLGLVRSVPGRVRSALGNLGSLLYNSGQAIIRGLISGIQSMIGSLVGTVKGAVSKARDLLPFSPAKEGPFSGRGWTTYSGASIMQGLADGITSNAPKVNAAVNSVLSNARTGLDQARIGVTGTGTSAASATGGGSLITIENLVVQIEGTFDFSDPSAAKRLATQVAPAMKEEIRKVERAYV